MPPQKKSSLHWSDRGGTIAGFMVIFLFNEKSEEKPGEGKEKKEPENDKETKQEKYKSAKPEKERFE